MKKRIIEFPRRVISLFFILSVLLISACGSESQRANDSPLEEKTDHDHTGHNHGGHDHHSGDDFIDLSSITSSDDRDEFLENVVDYLIKKLFNNDRNV